MSKEKTKAQKTSEGIRMKDAIQQLLLTTPMSNNELAMKFKTSTHQISNYLTALKHQELIVWHPDDMKKHISMRRYIALPNKEKFSDILEVKRKLQYENGFKKVHQNRLSNKKPQGKIHLLMNTTMTKPAQKTKRSAWSGYGSFNV